MVTHEPVFGSLLSNLDASELSVINFGRSSFAKVRSYECLNNRKFAMNASR